jgi:hypothetical protein
MASHLHAATKAATGLARAIAAGLGLLAGGCTTLLPSSRTEVVSVWSSYDDAVSSLATVAPYQSTRQSVHAQGLDPGRCRAGVTSRCR